MTKRLTIKDHHGESRLFTRRCIAALLIIFFFAIALLSRLVYLQIIEHKRYSTLSRKNVLEILPTNPNRGIIYDRNGVVLAKNIPVFNLTLTPARVKNISKTLSALQKILPLTEDDIKNFKRSLKFHHRFDAIPIKMNLTEKEMAAFYINRYRFPGVMIKSQLFRTYPLGKELSDVVGYVGRISAKELARVNPINYSASDYIGKRGIEKYYENVLHGKVGDKEVEIDANGNIVREIKRDLPAPGNNIYLTIDSRLQAYAEKAMGDNDGAVVIIQPSTGQVLALVTNPSYDPNAFVNGISAKNYHKLLYSPDHPLFNRAIRGQYAPASTIKPFIAITGLESQAIDTQTKIFDPGWFRLPKTKHIYHDWKYNGHGWVNVSKAIMVSCDTFFYELAVKLGITKIHTMLARFGFGKSTHIDMPDELPGLLPSPHWKHETNGNPWYTGDTIITGIGQGFLLATPLQIAEATATLAEHGERYQPHLLLKLQKTDDSFLTLPRIEKPPVVLEHPSVWNTVIHAMEGVVRNPIGTAESFGRHPGYTVAAKTGTAQVFGHHRDEERSRLNIPKKLRNHHLFIAFAPVKHPQIAIAIVIEHAAGADRIARHIMDYYFKYCAKEDKAKTDEQSTR